MTPQGIGLFLVVAMLSTLLVRAAFLWLQWRHYAKRDPGFAERAPDPCVLMFGMPGTWLLYDWFVAQGDPYNDLGGIHAERQAARANLKEMIRLTDRCAELEKELEAAKTELATRGEARRAGKTWEPGLGDAVYVHGAKLSFAGTVMGATKADEVLVRNGSGIVHTVPRHMVHKYLREDQP